jgi:uncharacterized metal-binding protein (TIGR02443 family)
MTKYTQFIAGAICPACSEADTIAIHKDNDEIYCVKCEYKEFRPGSPKDPKEEQKLRAVDVVDITNFNTIKK